MINNDRLLCWFIMEEVTSGKQKYTFPTSEKIEMALTGT